MRPPRWPMLILLLLPPIASAAAATPLTVIANDSMVKDKTLPQVIVEVRSATAEQPRWSKLTDAQGQATFDLAPGTYLVALTADDYVQLEADVVEVGARPQTVTITLTQKLQGTDDERRRRLQIVLNWGTDEEHHVRDADAHLLCGCGQEHVYFGDKEHAVEDHHVQLDVDDMDWGGPETITVFDGPAGEYVYWVYDFSAAAEPAVKLGASEVIVRVIGGDEVLGQYRIPADHPHRVWRPFKHVAIDSFGAPTVALFTAAELAAGAAAELPPPEIWPPGTSPSEGESCDDGCDCTAPSLALLAGLAGFLVVRARRKRR